MASWAAIPVSCSAVRLKRSMRPWRSVTTIRTPAVSRIAAVRSRVRRVSSSNRWIVTPPTVATASTSSALRGVLAG
jgi:hypothetical protein